MIKGGEQKKKTPTKLILWIIFEKQHCKRRNNGDHIVWAEFGFHSLLPWGYYHLVHCWQSHWENYILKAIDHRKDVKWRAWLERKHAASLLDSDACRQLQSCTRRLKCQLPEENLNFYIHYLLHIVAIQIDRHFLVLPKPASILKIAGIPNQTFKAQPQA